MVREGNEIANGWPLGLGSMNSRIRVSGSTSQPAVAAQPYTSVILHRCSSFSSFSSSNLDTESTASFVPDQSVSLGRLTGIRPPNKGRLLYYEQQRRIPADEGMPKDPMQTSRGLCAPLLYHVIGKMSRNGSSSRH